MWRCRCRCRCRGVSGISRLHKNGLAREYVYSITYPVVQVNSSQLRPPLPIGEVLYPISLMRLLYFKRAVQAIAGSSQSVNIESEF